MRKIALISVLGAAFALSTPAFAGNFGFGIGSYSTGPTTQSSPTTTSGGSTAVPEPGVLGLMGLGLVGLGMARRRRRQTRD